MGSADVIQPSSPLPQRTASYTDMMFFTKAVKGEADKMHKERSPRLVRHTRPEAVSKNNDCNDLMIGELIISARLVARRLNGNRRPPLCAALRNVSWKRYRGPIGRQIVFGIRTLVVDVAILILLSLHESINLGLRHLLTCWCHGWN